MSAWYALNAIGIYQMAPGNPEFIVRRPVIDQAKINMNDGWFEIKVINNSRSNKYAHSVKLNGVILPNNKLQYSDIRAGNTLEISMVNKPGQ